MMGVLQKQLSDKVHIKHLGWMEPFAKTQTSIMKLFCKIPDILVKHLRWTFLQKYITVGI